MADRGQTYDRDDELWLRLDDGRHDLRSQGQMGARDAFRIGCGAPESPHGGATAGWRHGCHEEVHSRESICASSRQGACRSCGDCRGGMRKG